MQTNTLARMLEIARRIAQMRAERANVAARRAGLGPDRNVWHNAWLSYQAGRPWVEVDYSALRLAMRIDALPSATRIVDAYYRRMTNRAQ